MEEVVVNADPLNRQKGLPELAQSAFSGIGWRNVVTGILYFRLWQGPGIELAVGRCRETVYRYKGSRHHISGQFLVQLIP